MGMRHLQTSGESTHTCGEGHMLTWKLSIRRDQLIPVNSWIRNAVQIWATQLSPWITLNENFNEIFHLMRWPKYTICRVCGVGCQVSMNLIQSRDDHHIDVLSSCSNIYGGLKFEGYRRILHHFSFRIIFPTEQKMKPFQWCHCTINFTDFRPFLLQPYPFLCFPLSILNLYCHVRLSLLFYLLII